MVLGSQQRAQRRRSRRVLCIGDTLVDEVHDSNTVSRFAGGSGLLFAIGMQRLNVPAALITSLGTDYDGRWLHEVLRSHDVRVFADAPLPLSGVAVSKRDEKGVPQYEFNEAMSNRYFDFTADARAAVRDARIVVVNNFPLDDRQQAETLIDTLSRASGLRVIDPNPRPALLQDILRFSANFERIAADADLVSLSRRDTDLLYGIDADALASRLLDQGTRAVLITEGERGVTLRLRSGAKLHHPIVGLPGPVIDTMGASTAVLATIVATLYEKGSQLGEDEWMEALSRSQLIAAATCRTIGGILELPRY